MTSWADKINLDTGAPTSPASEADTKVEKVIAVALQVTTPLMQGPQVLEVQQKLSLRGLFTEVCDGVYGPSTEIAVKSFQKSRGLTVDGIVGPITLSALYAAPAPVTTTTGNSLGLLALDEADKHLGLKEDPAGSNKTMFGLWYGHDGLPWCSIFVSYCFAVGANKILCNGFAGPGTKASKGCAYVPTVEAWLKATGQWQGTTNPQPGDIVIFTFEGGEADHIGILVSNLGGGNFTTVEGNTSPNNQANGGEVMLRTRNVKQIAGFGRIS